MTETLFERFMKVKNDALDYSISMVRTYEKFLFKFQYDHPEYREDVLRAISIAHKEEKLSQDDVLRLASEFSEAQ